jgi:hypothetical protein
MAFGLIVFPLFLLSYYVYQQYEYYDPEGRVVNVKVGTLTYWSSPTYNGQNPAILSADSWMSMDVHKIVHLIRFKINLILLILFF